MRGELTRSNSVLVCVRFRIHRYEGAPFNMAIKAGNKYHAERSANVITNNFASLLFSFLPTGCHIPEI